MPRPVLSRIATWLLILAGVAALTPAVSPKPAKAFTPNNFFGGKITKVTYCPCVYDPAVIVSVKDFATHMTVNVKYSLWISKLDENYNIWEQGPYVMGGFSRGYASCLQQSGYYCKTNNSAPKPIDGVIDWVRGIGSSASGGASFSIGF